MGDHGVPYWDARDPLNDWQISTTVDFAEQALAAERKRYQDNDIPIEGVIFTVTNLGRPDDSVLYGDNEVEVNG